MQGSSATRVPTATGQSAPASMTRPAVSWPRTKGKVPREARVGDGPVLWAKRWRSLPQIPPVVTVDAGPRRAGQVGLGQLDQRRRELGVDHVELDGAHLAKRMRVRTDRRSTEYTVVA